MFLYETNFYGNYLQKSKAIVWQCTKVLWLHFNNYSSKKIYCYWTGCGRNWLVPMTPKVLRQTWQGWYKYKSDAISRANALNT